MIGSRLIQGAHSVFYVAFGSLAAICLVGCDGRPRTAHALEGSSRVGSAFTQPRTCAPPAIREPAPAPAPEPTPYVEPAPMSGFEIESPQVVPVSPTLAKVTWTTALWSDSRLEWGSTADLDGTAIIQPEPTLQHSVLLRGLAPGQSYSCRVSSRSEGGDLAVSAVISFETPAVETYAVRRTHPRILFSEEDIPRLKQRIAGSHAREWASLVTCCEGALSKGSATVAASDSNYKYARALAFAGLIGDDSRFRSKAIEIGIECAKLGTGGDTMAVRWRAVALSSVYDWLYGYIGDSARSTMRNALAALGDRLESLSNDHEFVWGMSHGNQRPLLLASLAICGESSDAAARVDRIVRDYRDGYLSTWRNYSDQGGSLKGWAYTTWTLNMEVEVLAALKSAAGIDWFATEPWFEHLVDWFALGMRSDGSFLRSGDSDVSEGVGSRDWIYALCVVHHYKSAKARWFAEKAVQYCGQWGILNVYDILWDDPSIAPEEPSGATCRFFRSPGMAVFRSSWDSGSVIGTFRCASDYTLGHTHRDNNTFTLFYKGGLAIDSGYYDDYGSSHNRNYYSRTIAHNGMLVYDPAETFVLKGQTHANDGGQRWLAPGVDVDACPPPHVEYVLDPTQGYQSAGILLFEDGDDYAYAVGDAAPSYSPSKVRAFDRHFLWLKDVAGSGHPVVAILDLVESTNASLKKTYLLHTQYRPEVQGSLVVASKDGGLLYQRTLLPSSPRIEVVGGAGKEYWVNGQNYPPQEATSAKDEAGAYRVEISPSVASKVDRFLHVLHATDVGAAEPRSGLVEASTMTGCAAGEWLVLIGTDRRGASTVSYAFGEENRRHLIVGLVPNSAYDIVINAERKARVTSSSRGSVRFDAQGSGQIEIVPAASNEVADTGSSLDASADMAEMAGVPGA